VKRNVCLLNEAREVGKATLADLVADGLPTQVITHQLQVERRTVKVRWSQTDVLPQCHATNQLLTTQVLLLLFITARQDER